MGIGMTGTDVGVARGRIEIDLSQLEQANRVVMSSARQMESAFSSLGTAAERSAFTQTSAWSKTIGAISKYQTAISAAVASFSVLGITGADNLLRLRTTFTLLAGSQEKSKKYMEELDRMAQRIKVPYDELLESAVAFLPVVSQTGVELSKVVEISARLQLKDPTARMRDSIIAINEILTGAPRSLAARFEIPAEVANTIARLAEEGRTDEALAELDKFLTSIGIGSEALEIMGDTGITAFSRLSSEVRLTTYQAFQPLSSLIDHIMNRLADLLMEVRRVDSGFLKFSATIVGLIGLGSGLKALGQIAGNIPVISSIPIPVGISNKGTALGVGAAALYGGGELGSFIIRKGLSQIMPAEGYAGLAGKDYLEQFGLDDAIRTLEQLLVIIVVKLGDVLAELVGVIDNAIGWIREALWDLTNVFLFGAQKFIDAINALLDTVDKIPGVNLARISALELKEPTTEDVVEALSKVLLSNENIEPIPWSEFDAFYQDVLDRWRDAGGDLVSIIEEILVPKKFDRAAAIQTAIRETLDQVSLQLAEKTGVVPKPFGPKPEPVRSILTPLEEKFFGEKELDLYRKFQEDLQKIDEEEQHQRLRLEQTYQRSLTREAEDEQWRRQKAAEALERNITQVWSQMQESIEKLNRQYSEREAELQEQYYEQELQRRKQFQDTLERLEQRHKENLIQAAARLDATAVWREQRQFQLNQSETKKQFDEQSAQRREAFQKQLEELREQHARQLEETRAAAEKRVEQLKKDFELQEQLHARERERRLVRMQQDYQQQLKDLDNQFQKQRALRESQFTNELIAQTNHEQLKLALTKKGFSDLESEFKAWFERQKAIISGETTGTEAGTGEAVGAAQYVQFQGQTVRIDQYDPNFSGGMSASTWYQWTRLMGYQSGGYTGSGFSNQIAGLVHANEFVIPSKGAPVLFSERLNSLLERVGAIFSRPIETRPILVPYLPPVIPKTETKVGQISINIQDKNDPRETAKLVRMELLRTFQELSI